MRASLALLLVACGTVSESNSDSSTADSPPGPDSPGGDDGPPSVDAPTSCVPWIATNFVPCPTSALPTQSLVVSASTTIDTDTGEVRQSGALVTLVSTVETQSGGPQLRRFDVLELRVEGA